MQALSFKNLNPKIVNKLQTAYVHEKSRRRLIDFTLHTKPDYEVNWHHERLCEALDKLISGETKRLMVFMPPRNGKSELGSRRFPAYLLGKDPNAQIIAASYSADLASRMNRDVQRIIDSPEYRDLFPNTSLNGSNVKTIGNGSYVRNSDIFEIVGHKGFYKSSGIGGGITGMGMTYGIIDDPFKNRKEAESKTIRNAVWDWYASTFYTRLEKDARVLIILTRWHEDDLAGRLLKQAEEDPEAEQWTVINYPAIAEQPIDETDPREIGEPLWPSKYSLEALTKIKKAVGTYEWSALYQQRPSPSEGNILNRKWWKYYRVRPERFDEIIQSWDCAFKDNNDSDFVVGQVWGKIGADKYLLDQVKDRMDLPTTINALKNLTAKWPSATTKLIEDKANGPAVIQMLKHEISGMIPVNPQGGKVARAYAASPEVEAGNVYLPDPSIAPWIHDFVEETAAFPNSTNDDATDCFTQAMIHWQTPRDIKRVARPTIGSLKRR
ncbi:putative phage terminase large subunit-like protein [Priestia megaterium]|uniref:phage terminase large subunit n=1 Tax=Priestia megaterium TaxID=1404 RepID=UPI003395F1FF